MNRSHRGRVRLKEKRLKNSRAWRRLTQKESGAGPAETGSTDGEGGLIHDQHSTTSPKMMKASRCLGD